MNFIKSFGYNLGLVTLILLSAVFVAAIIFGPILAALIFLSPLWAFLASVVWLIVAVTLIVTWEDFA